MGDSQVAPGTEINGDRLNAGVLTGHGSSVCIHQPIPAWHMIGLVERATFWLVPPLLYTTLFEHRGTGNGLIEMGSVYICLYLSRICVLIYSLEAYSILYHSTETYISTKHRQLFPLDDFPLQRTSRFHCKLTGLLTVNHGYSSDSSSSVFLGALETPRNPASS